MLWKEIIDNMFMLWALAEDDLLYAEEYKLTDTGQGDLRHIHRRDINNIHKSDRSD
jgi:hypothetical protein